MSRRPPDRRCGLSRLRKLLNKDGGGPLARLKSELETFLDRFLGSREQRDDKRDDIPMLSFLVRLTDAADISGPESHHESRRYAA